MKVAATVGPRGWALVSGRYLLLLALGALALAASWAAVVLASASWAEARALDQVFPYFEWHIRPFSAADWHLYQRVSAGLAALLSVVWLALGPLSRAGRTELHTLGAELAQLGRALAGRWQALAPVQRRWALGSLAVLTAVRLYLSWRLHWADDAVSYEFFVRGHLLAPAAYYPLPNNHILSNVIDWLFYRLHPGFWWSMRLPVLLASTFGSWLLWAGLQRRLGFAPALLAASLMSWVELSLYHAAAGRGYWLVATAAAALFLAVLALQAPPEAGQATSPRVAWLAVVVAGMVGCYAVPVGVYALASALGWVGLRAVVARQWRLVAQAVAVGAATVGSLGLLYAPTLLVSGPAAIFNNSYVQRLPVGEFWRELPLFSWLTEGQLLGQRHVGAVLLVVLLGLFGRLWLRVRRGQVAPALAQAVRTVGLPALWFMGLPYALLLAQRVLPPPRTWLYKSWFDFILVALVLAEWDWRPPARRGLLALGLTGYVGYQVGNQLRLNHNAWQGVAHYRTVQAWLTAHPAARPALIPEVFTWAWFRFHVSIDCPGQPFTAEQVAQPGRRYGSMVVLGPQAPPAGTGPLWYQAGNLYVYHLDSLATKTAVK